MCGSGPMARASTMPEPTQTQLERIADNAGNYHSNTPPQNNYETLKKILHALKDEVFWTRKELEDLRGEHTREVTETNNLIFDLTELVARLAVQIEVWVGVEEE